MNREERRQQRHAEERQQRQDSAVIEHLVNHLTKPETSPQKDGVDAPGDIVAGVVRRHVSASHGQALNSALGKQSCVP